jgi:hypothetical protein
MILQTSLSDAHVAIALSVSTIPNTLNQSKYSFLPSMWKEITSNYQLLLTESVQNILSLHVVWKQKKCCEKMTWAMIEFFPPVNYYDFFFKKTNC